MPTEDVFADLLAANRAYAAHFDLAHLPGRAAKRLAVLTCMDTRLDPLRILGLAPGDAKIMRNAGARVDADVLATLVLSAYLLDIDRVMVLAHTRCRMAGGTEADVHVAIRDAGGPDTRSLPFRTTTDQDEAVRADVQRIRSYPYLANFSAGGFRYDVDTGLVGRIC